MLYKSFLLVYNLTEGTGMKRIDMWRAKLKAARSEAKHKERQMNAAVRSYKRTDAEVIELERKIYDYLAKTKQ